MIAKTLKAHSLDAIIKKIDGALSEAFKPTLAIVFPSIKHNHVAITDFLNDKDIAVFGVTTAGEFIDGDIESESIVVMLLDINPSYFKLKFIETNIEDTFNNAKALGAFAKEAFKNPALIVATGGLFIDGDHIVDGITKGFGTSNTTENNEVTLFGGMAGDDLLTVKPLVFTNNKAADNAILALIIDKDKIDVRGIATCGWKSIGTTKTVTKSEGNTVYTIDDKPALDMLIKYLGVEIAEDTDNDIVPFQTSWFYPLQIDRDNGDFVIRATRFANSKERSLICTGSVPQGSQIKFSLPPEFEAIDTVVSECASIKDNQEQNADALIMFSCVSRHLSFGDVISEEIEQVKNVWNAPLVGFFTYGEYGKSKVGINEFHNNACCIIALKEKI